MYEPDPPVAREVGDEPAPVPVGVEAARHAPPVGVALCASGVAVRALVAPLLDEDLFDHAEVAELCELMLARVQSKV